MLSRNRWREGFASITWASAQDYRIRDPDPPRLRRLNYGLAIVLYIRHPI